MTISFKKSFLGYKPEDVHNEIKRLDIAYEKETTALQAEIEKTKSELEQVETEVTTLQLKLENYIAREQSIVEVMVLAQKKAVQLEEDARRQAKAMLELTEKELLEKRQELERLQEKLALFKQEFKELLDGYRFSIENVGTLPKEPAPQLTLLENERATEAIKSILRKRVGS
ncbi:MAG: DivIVA domain-containing protein [Bacillota bacterium]